MTRIPVAILAGAVLALVLFWLLALLVSPPEQEIEVLEMPLTMTQLAPAPEPEAAEPATPPPPAVPPAATPPPPPEPAPLPDAALALPEPELPAERAEPVALDSSLPELAEVRPDPPPQEPPPPEPRREPPREPRAAPAPDPAPAPATATASSPAAESPVESVAQAPVSREPVDVGQIAPTRRVPPAYPSRAQRRGLEGYVELQFVIRPDGEVAPDSIRVLAARPANVFDKAARRAVSRWRFEPAQGLRRARQRLEFKLR
ncbi:TonB family protein [Halomonas sp.]|uniref:energy transducer TonB n=1 Tax=Halomonas sp. TaxID=1486246 RepID=UPI003D0D781E